MPSLSKYNCPTPADRSYFESLILQDPWNVSRLYASNLFESQSFKKEVKHLARERLTELHRMDSEIENIRRMIKDLEKQKEEVKYLPPKHYRRLSDVSICTTVVADIRKPSVAVLPSIFQTQKKSKNKRNGEENKYRQKPLYLPKLSKSRIQEITRKRTFVDVPKTIAYSTLKRSFPSYKLKTNDSNINDTPRIRSQSIQPNINDTPRIRSQSIQPNINDTPRIRSQSIQPKRNAIKLEERYRSKSLQDLPSISNDRKQITVTSITGEHIRRNRSSPEKGNESCLGRGYGSSSGRGYESNSSKKYKHFYTDKDFLSTTAKFLPRNMRVNRTHFW